jgi:AraC family ethanolamine operon transcriptional activator
MNSEISGTKAFDSGFDLAAAAGILRVCELDIVLLGTAQLNGRVNSHVEDGCVFITGCYDFAFRGRFTLPEEWCLLAYVHDTSLSSWCHGVGLESGSVGTIVPESSCEFLFAAGTSWTLVLVPQAMVRAEIARLSPDDTEIPAHRLRMFVADPASDARPLIDVYQRTRRQVRDGVSLPLVPRALIHRHLKAALNAEAEHRPVASRGRRAHYQTLRRVEEFMRANLRRDIYIQELCNAAGASERALRYAFDDLLGIPPNRYLSLLRLCVAYRSLVHADASRRSVKSIALSCGMWDLSRFAEHYRHTFGELPRATLTRASIMPMRDMDPVPSH